jgi:signal transduction histidine kinase
MRLRLIISFAFVVLVSVGTYTLVARRATEREVQAFMFRGNIIEMDSLVNSLEDYYRQNGSWQGVASILPGSGQGLRRGQPGTTTGMQNQRLRLGDADGKIIVDTSGEDIGNTFSAPEQRSAQRLQVNGRLVGYLLFERDMGLTSVDQAFLLTRLNRAALIAALVAGGIALILALVLSDRLIQPVQRLTHGATRLAQGDLSYRVGVKGDDELANLGRAFNDMADNLQQAHDARRAMTADIAHELRTPLAVQRAHLEALQDGVYEPTSENLQPVLEQNILLTRLVDDLRILALADAGQLQLERAPTNPVNLIEDVIKRFEPQSARRQIKLTFRVDPTISPNLLLNIDPIRVEQILGNLLSNALRFTPDGGLIETVILVNTSSAVIRVQDSGTGIPSEALEHIFERFYRADRSRSRSEGGSGLGLAIARQLAELHGGSLTAANSERGGAVFSLSLPLH